METVDIEGVARRLEKMISSIDDDINSLGKERFSTYSGRLIQARGRAMRDLASISDNKEELLGYAIGSITEAVNIFNRLRDEHNSARVHYELGLAYLAMAALKDHQRNTDIAIRAFDEAREQITYDDDPELYRKIEEKEKGAWRTY